MFADVIFATDGSERSFTALPVAASLARGFGTTVRIVAGWGDLPKAVMRYRVDNHRWQLGDADHELRLERHDRPIAYLLRDTVAEYPGSFICMTTHGRGRSAAVLGSVAVETIAHTDCPVVLVGPHCASVPVDPDGPLIVATNGMPFADSIIPIAKEFAAGMGMATDVVTAAQIDVGVAVSLTAGATQPFAPAHASHVAATSAHLALSTNQPSSWEILNSTNPATAIVDHAKNTNAAMVAMATHDEYHLRRFINGSITAGVVRRATCPVLTIGPRSA